MDVTGNNRYRIIEGNMVQLTNESNVISRFITGIEMKVSKILAIKNEAR